MSQINYKSKIIKSLLNKPNHIRGLAKELSTNQTTISRKLEELSKNNVVDSIIQGRNKIFQLKKTIETKQECYIMESEETLKILNKHIILKKIFNEIRNHEKIHLSILFGSYSKDQITKNSDIDIYIETDEKQIKKDIEKINSKISVKIGKYQDNELIQEIEKNHTIIKGIEEFYEKNNLFKKLVL